MSGVLKGVKKVFKKVAKVAKKVLPYALPIAAGLFTIGGFLGIPAMAGGWGGAVSGLFGNSMLGSVLGGAVTQAGYGGLIGMGIGGATGGKKGMLKGSLIGQAAGAVTGGVTGAIGYAGNPAARAATGSTQASAVGGPGAAPGSAPGTASSGLSRSTQAMSSYGDALPGQVAGPMSYAGQQGMVPATAGMAQGQAASGITQAAQRMPSAAMVPQAGMAVGGQAAATGFKSLDPIVQSSMIMAGSQALPAAIGAFTGGDDENSQLEVERERRAAIEANYKGFGPTMSLPSIQNRPTLRYEYDPAAGRVVPKYA